MAQVGRDLKSSSSYHLLWAGFQTDKSGSPRQETCIRKHKAKTKKKIIYDILNKFRFFNSSFFFLSFFFNWETERTFLFLSLVSYILKFCFFLQERENHLQKVRRKLSAPLIIKMRLLKQFIKIKNLNAYANKKLVFFLF